MVPNYLRLAANDLHRRLRQREPAPSEVVEAAGIGCDALSHLVEDDNYLAELQRAFWLADGQAGAMAGLFAEPRRWRDFGDFARRLLLDAGVEAPLAAALLGQMEDLAGGLRADGLAPHDLPGQREALAALRALQAEACALARRPEAAAQAQERLLRLTEGLGGAILVGAAAALTAGGTARAPGVVAALACAFGGGLIDAAVTPT